MATYRRRAEVLSPVTSVTVEQHAELKKLSATREISWSTSTGEYGHLIGKFRSEAKGHYYRWQRRRCCYCSVELQNHKFTYDAEHILDQSTYPEYIFEERNLAAVCKLCNQSKSNKSVSSNGTRFTELSENTADYSIIHPHYDEWNAHLKFDEIGRIVPVTNSRKGKNTIHICGIAHINAARLADEFAIDKDNKALTALRSFHEISDIARKQELLTLISEMAQPDGYPGAIAIVQALREDVASLQITHDGAKIISEVGASSDVVASSIATTAVKPEAQVETQLLLEVQDKVQ